MADTPIRDWHRIAVELLMTDADLALQSISALFSSDDREAVARIVQNSRGVYDSIQEKRKAVMLSQEEAATLDRKVELLRERLKLLGEQL